MSKSLDKLNLFFLILILVLIIYIIVEIQNIKKQDTPNNIRNNKRNNINNKPNDNNLIDKEYLERVIKENNDKQSKDIVWYIGQRFFNDIIWHCKKNTIFETDYYRQAKDDVKLDLSNYNSSKNFYQGSADTIPK